MNCTALVEFDTGVDFQWSYPGRPVGASVVRRSDVNEWKIWTFGTRFPSPGQTNSLVDIKTHREALSQATEAVSILTIHRVNVTDTGLYCCNVTSIGTRQSQQTQVIVYGKNPSCAFFFLLRGTSSAPTFVCLFGSDDGAALGAVPSLSIVLESKQDLWGNL